MCVRVSALVCVCGVCMCVCPDRALGVCECYSDFTSSDGFGNMGGRGDCGVETPLL
ncbi:MAG: hypothetical protein P4L40_17585 [Terracidiphilus sp.]|nr:hypothetical protein [Terracidiphilus sp.]